VIAYVDEGGSHKGTTVFGLACLVGRENDWDTFRARWERLLWREGIPDVHMVDLEARRGPYESWPDERYRRLRDQVGAIMAGWIPLYSFFNPFFMKDYDQVVRRRRGWAGSPCAAMASRQLTNGRSGYCARVLRLFHGSSPSRSGRARPAIHGEDADAILS
jgi:hypothetical protein